MNVRVLWPDKFYLNGNIGWPISKQESVLYQLDDVNSQMFRFRALASQIFPAGDLLNYLVKWLCGDYTFHYRRFDPLVLTLENK